MPRLWMDIRRLQSSNQGLTGDTHSPRVRLPRDPSPCNSRPGDLKLESKGFRNFCTSIRSIKNAGCTRNLKVFGCSALIWSKKFNRDEGWESWDTGVGTSSSLEATDPSHDTSWYLLYAFFPGVSCSYRRLIACKLSLPSPSSLIYPDISKNYYVNYKGTSNYRLWYS